MHRWFKEISGTFVKIYQKKLNALLSKGIENISQQDFDRLYQTMAHEITEILRKEINSWKNNFNSYSFGTFMLSAYAQLKKLSQAASDEVLYTKQNSSYNKIEHNENILFNSEDTRIRHKNEEDSECHRRFMNGARKQEIQKLNHRFDDDYRQYYQNPNKNSWFGRREINKPNEKIAILRHNIKLG